jgi:hypothetical protein
MARLSDDNIPPIRGNGFVYILSKPSFRQGIYKIGITAGAVSDRIRRLNNTSTPSSFKVERLFEVQLKYLESVERSAHSYLVGKQRHVGREFFDASLEECEAAIEIAIHSVRKKIV